LLGVIGRERLGRNARRMMDCMDAMGGSSSIDLRCANRRTSMYAVLASLIC
jgi:hypothetical protein